MLRLPLAALALLASISAVSAAELPAICLEDARDTTHAMGGGGMTMDMPPPDQAHQDLMAGMDKMNADMMAGGTATNIDVAFVCSMIPHHQGAIDMARAELTHGSDSWAREMAQKV